MILQLQKQAAAQTKQNAAQAKRITELESELKELRKKNPTLRLDEAFSMKVEEKRREEAQQHGKPLKKKQNCKRRGRITTAEKLAKATQQEDIAADKRLSEAGRRTRVVPLIDAIRDCTRARIADETKPADDAEKDFFNLTHEIVRLLGGNELITFVIHPEADGTNTISERQVRDAAQDRLTGPTNTAERGARRYTLITSVPDSLRAYVTKLTLKSPLEELDR